MRSILRAAVPLPLLAVVLVSCDGGTEPVDPPPAPVDFQAAAASNTEVLLTWSLPAGEEVREFRIERASNGGPFSMRALVAGNVTSHRDTGLSPATQYRYRIQACDEGGCSPFSGEVAVTTNAPLAITTGSLPNGVRGQAYNGGLNATGGLTSPGGTDSPGDYIWTLTGGSLPAGLNLTERGIISGIPTTAQVATFTVRVRSGDGQTASRQLSITVVAEQAAEALGIITTRIPPALQGSPYLVELAARGGGGAPYTWSVVSGSLPPGVSLGSGGAFSGSPTSTGTFTFAVRAASAGQAGQPVSTQTTYTVQVVANDRTGFSITAFEVAVVPASIRPHVQAAIARWERVIVGDLGAVSIPKGFFSPTFCGGFGELINGTAVDDIIVMVDISPLDGPGQILGQAGPCGIRESRLPFAGVLTLDSEDLQPLVGTQTLTDIVFHEIGHILGFGVLWDPLDLMLGGGTADPRYTGPLAVQEFQQLGRTGSVPLENQGGEGTADSHWREAVFNTEVMTGYSEQTGVRQPLSRMTIASMADMGYTVSYTQADAYSLPAALMAPGAAQDERPAYDDVLRGPVRVLPTGGGR